METVLGFSLLSKLALVALNKSRILNNFVPYESLYVKQLQCLKYYYEHPKSANCRTLVFDILPHFRFTTESDVIVLIISPLRVISDCILLRHGKDAYEVKMDSFGDEQFKCGSFKLAVSFPEVCMSDKILRTMSIWTTRVQWIVIDEAHCVPQWGAEFRKDFNKLVKLRTIFIDARVVCLTATLTKTIICELSSSLALKELKCISSSADRPNITILMKLRAPNTGGDNNSQSSVFSILEPLVVELVEMGNLFPKTVIFTKLKWCGHGFEFVRRKLLVAKRSVDCIGQYHASCVQENKTNTASSFSKEDGTIKLLFATEAFGMGVDVPDIRRVVHIGPPSTIELYVQEMGRAGRDGQHATAILYFNASDIASNVNTLQQDMRDLCKTKDCKRQFLASYFMNEHAFSGSLHSCCSSCETLCSCELCNAANTFDDH